MKVLKSLGDVSLEDMEVSTAQEDLGSPEGPRLAENWTGPAGTEDDPIWDEDFDLFGFIGEDDEEQSQTSVKMIKQEPLDDYSEPSTTAGSECKTSTKQESLAYEYEGFEQAQLGGQTAAHSVDASSLPSTSSSPGGKIQLGGVGSSPANGGFGQMTELMEQVEQLEVVEVEVQTEHKEMKKKVEESIEEKMDWMIKNFEEWTEKMSDYKMGKLIECLAKKQDARRGVERSWEEHWIMVAKTQFDAKLYNIGTQKGLEELTQYIKMVEKVLFKTTLITCGIDLKDAATEVDDELEKAPGPILQDQGVQCEVESHEEEVQTGMDLIDKYVDQNKPEKREQEMQTGADLIPLVTTEAQTGLDLVPMIAAEVQVGADLVPMLAMGVQVEPNHNEQEIQTDEPNQQSNKETQTSLDLVKPLFDEMQPEKREQDMQTGADLVPMFAIEVQTGLDLVPLVTTEVQTDLVPMIAAEVQTGNDVVPMITAEVQTGADLVAMHAVGVQAMQVYNEQDVQTDEPNLQLEQEVQTDDDLMDLVEARIAQMQPKRSEQDVQTGADLVPMLIAEVQTGNDIVPMHTIGVQAVQVHTEQDVQTDEPNLQLEQEVQTDAPMQTEKREQEMQTNVPKLKKRETQTEAPKLSFVKHAGLNNVPVRAKLKNREVQCTVNHHEQDVQAGLGMVPAVQGQGTQTEREHVTKRSVRVQTGPDHVPKPKERDQGVLTRRGQRMKDETEQAPIESKNGLDDAPVQPVPERHEQETQTDEPTSEKVQTEVKVKAVESQEKEQDLEVKKVVVKEEYIAPSLSLEASLFTSGPFTIETSPASAPTVQRTPILAPEVDSSDVPTSSVRIMTRNRKRGNEAIMPDPSPASDPSPPKMIKHEVPEPLKGRVRFPGEVKEEVVEESRGGRRGNEASSSRHGHQQPPITHGARKSSRNRIKNRFYYNRNE